MILATEVDMFSKSDYFYFGLKLCLCGLLCDQKFMHACTYVILAYFGMTKSKMQSLFLVNEFLQTSAERTFCIQLQQPMLGTRRIAYSQVTGGPAAVSRRAKA